MDRRSPVTPVATGTDLEARVRQLELWAVAAHAHLGAIEERAQGFIPVIDQLQVAAQSQAAITAAEAERRAARDRRPAAAARMIGMLAGAVGILGFLLKLSPR